MAAANAIVNSRLNDHPYDNLLNGSRGNKYIVKSALSVAFGFNCTRLRQRRASRLYPSMTRSNHEIIAHLEDQLDSFISQ